MPHELPSPRDYSSVSSSAGRCLSRQIKINETQPQNQSAEPSQFDVLLDSNSWFLPVPAIMGPLAFKSAFQRISAQLKPFVRLPLHPLLEPQTLVQESGQRRRRASSLPAVQKGGQTYTCTSFDDLARLAPAPWTSFGPVPPMKVAYRNPPRSNTVDTMSSDSSSSTHHISTVDMYRTGELNSRFSPPPSSPQSQSQPDSRVPKKKRTRQARRSSVRHAIPNRQPPWRASNIMNTTESSNSCSSKTNSSSTDQSKQSSTESSATNATSNSTTITDPSSNNDTHSSHQSKESVNDAEPSTATSTTSPTIAVRLHFTKRISPINKSTSLTIDRAKATMAHYWRSPTARTSLRRTLRKHPHPHPQAQPPSSPPASPPPSPARPKSSFMFPHERRQRVLHKRAPARRDTVSSTTTATTFGSTFTDSLAQQYRASGRAMKRFVDGHWRWVGVERRGEVLLDCVAEDGEDGEGEGGQWWRWLSWEGGVGWW